MLASVPMSTTDALALHGWLQEGGRFAMRSIEKMADLVTGASQFGVESLRQAITILDGTAIPTAPSDAVTAWCALVDSVRVLDDEDVTPEQFRLRLGAIRDRCEWFAEMLSAASATLGC